MWTTYSSIYCFKTLLFCHFTRWPGLAGTAKWLKKVWLLKLNLVDKSRKFCHVLPMSNANLYFEFVMLSSHLHHTTVRRCCLHAFRSCHEPLSNSALACCTLLHCLYFARLQLSYKVRKVCFLRRQHLHKTKGGKTSWHLNHSGCHCYCISDHATQNSLTCL